MIRFSIIKTVFRKELREMLRDRRSLAVMFGVPLVLYPLLTIGMASLTSSKFKEMERTKYKIALISGDQAPEFKRRLSNPDNGFELVEPDSVPLEFLRAGQIEAILEVPPRFEHDALANQPTAISLKVDRSHNESGVVERKLQTVLADYQQWIIAQRLINLNVAPEVTQGINSFIQDVSPRSEKTGNRLGMIMPLLVLVTGMLGSLFPALSATTTERELGTLETLLVSPASRFELLLAKGLLVLLCGIVTAATNMLSMSMVLVQAMSMAQPQDRMSIDILALLLMFLTAIPAIIFFTTLALIVGMLARTFREANAYATPAMLLPLASLALTVADVKTTTALLVTPIANTTLVMRDVLRGKSSFMEISLAFGSSLLYAGLLLSVAARLFSNEQLVNPSWEPLSFKGLSKNRSQKRGLPAVDQGIALFALSMLLLFYIQPHLIGLPLLPMIAVTQVALVFGPAALFTWICRWNVRETFLLHRPRALGALGGALLGIGLTPVIALLSTWQHQFWPTPPEHIKATNDLIKPTLLAHPILTALGIGAMAGIFEELLYRGAIQKSLLRKTPAWFAILATAALFAAAHLDLHGFVIRLALGTLLGWIAWRSGSIIPAMLAHGLYDATMLGLMAWGESSQSTPSTAIDWQTWTAVATGALLAAGGALLLHKSSQAHSTPQGVTECSHG